MVMVRVLDSTIKSSRFRLLTVPLSCNDPGQVVHTHTCLCHQAVQFGTGQRAVMLFG